MWEAAPSHLHRDWVLPAGCGAQPWLQNTWGLRTAWTVLFQPYSSPTLLPFTPCSSGAGVRSILSPPPPGASLLPTFPTCARIVAIGWAPTMVFWHHQSPLPACTRCLSSGLTAHAELKQKGRRKHKAASLLPTCHCATELGQIPSTHCCF